MEFFAQTSTTGEGPMLHVGVLSVGHVFSLWELSPTQSSFRWMKMAKPWPQKKQDGLCTSEQGAIS
jgi:hypothetical protein